MKRTTMVAICLALAFIASNASAQDDTKAGWQIGASVVTGLLKRDDDLIDNNAFGFRIFTQYRFNKWFGIEGSYYNSDDFSKDAIKPGEPLDVLYRGPQIEGILYIPSPMEELDIFVKGGYFDFSVSSTIGGDNSSSGSDTGAVFGAGVALKITERMSFRTALDWYDVTDAELWTVDLGLEYHF